MSVVGGWVFVPLVLAASCLGLGLLADRLLGSRLPSQLLPGVGLSALIVIAVAFTSLDATAELAAPLCALLALVGFVFGRRLPWKRVRRCGVLLLPAAVTFVVFATPSILSGQASIAGYIKLDDSAVWLVLTDHVMSEGTTVGPLPRSSYSVTLESWLGLGYPVGAQMPLGVGSALTGVELAAAYQATIAFFAAVAALGFAATVRPLLGSPLSAGIAAAIATQASLMFGYATWGGIKEVAALGVLAQLGWPIAAVLRGEHILGRLGIVALVCGGLLGIFGVSGAVWVGPAMLAAFVGLLWRARASGGIALPRLRRDQLVPSAAIGVISALAALPVLANLEFAETVDVLSEPDRLAKLVEPLPLLQGAGLWPVGDFRFDPSRPWLVEGVAWLCVVGACTGVFVAVRHRRLELAALVLTTSVGVAAVIARGSPWVEAKALALLAPVWLLATTTAVLLGLRASSIAIRSFARVGGLALLATTAISTVAVIGSAWIAPRESLAELKSIGEQFAGEGPALVLDHNTYASRYFLRQLDAEGATDLRWNQVLGIDGQQFPVYSSVDADQVAVDSLLPYRLLVRRQSPSASRPPANYELQLAGEYWEVWERDDDISPPLARLPLGSGADPMGTAGCDDVRNLATTSGASSLRAASSRPPMITQLDTGSYPADWAASPYLLPEGRGTVSLSVSVDQPGTYRVWVGGSVTGRLEVEVDGRSAGSVRHQINNGGQWLRFGTVELDAGLHLVELSYHPRWITGTMQPPSGIGPLVLSVEAPGGDGSSVETIPLARATELCDGRLLDWVEAVR